jgi:hypothetical protein
MFLDKKAWGMTLLFILYSPKRYFLNERHFYGSIGYTVIKMLTSMSILLEVTLYGIQRENTPAGL